MKVDGGHIGSMCQKLDLGNRENELFRLFRKGLLFRRTKICERNCLVPYFVLFDSSLVDTASNREDEGRDKNQQKKDGKTDPNTRKKRNVGGSVQAKAILIQAL